MPRDELLQGVVKTSWLPTVDHPVIPVAERPKLAAGMVSGMLLGIEAGALNVTDEWNRLLPDCNFTKAEDFLTEAWRGKP